MSGLKSKSRINDILEVANREIDDGFGSTGAKPKKKTPVDRSDYEILPVTLMLRLTSDVSDVDSLPDDAPNVESTEKTGDQSGSAFAVEMNSEAVLVNIPLIVDSLAILHRNTEATALYDILIEGLCRSIRQIECSSVEQKLLTRIDEAGVPKTYSFLPAELGHFFSCVYFTDTPDDQDYARKYRKRLHHNLGLSVLRPLFRKGNRYVFRGEQPPNKYLVNPHLGIKSQSSKLNLFVYFHSH